MQRMWQAGSLGANPLKSRSGMKVIFHNEAATHLFRATGQSLLVLKALQLLHLERVTSPGSLELLVTHY